MERLVNEMQSLHSYEDFGPFRGAGPEGEIPWHFGEINGIRAFYMDFIKSITFEVDTDTSTEVQRGSSDGRKPFEVKLKKGEHITHFNGDIKRANVAGDRATRVIASLTFITNKGRELAINKENRPTEDRWPFSVPWVVGEFIEFFGRRTMEGYPTSIRARVKLTRVEPSSKESQPVGLFGRSKGSEFNYNEHTAIKGIGVAFADNGCVRSIAFLYGGINGRWLHGDAPTQPREEFKIDDEDEYLSSISGSFTSDGITSLTFLTNKKRTKTFGVANGTHFSSPLTGGEIVGFYGWSDKRHLHGIGAYFKPTPYHNRVKSIGPFGGAHAWDDGIHTRVKGIRFLLINRIIHYIMFVYHVDGNKDNEIKHPKGVSHQTGEKEVLLKDGEYLTSISGHTRDDGSIQALKFYTNRNSYPCGNPKGGKYFWYPSTGTNEIVGFHGTWGTTLNSIGVYVKPISACTETIRPIPKGSRRNRWDDGLHSHVIGYRVTDNEDHNKIESITFMYYDNVSSVEGYRHGGGDPSSGEWVMLNFPEERLISLTGSWSEEGNGTTIIHDLQLHTTRQRSVLTYANRGDSESKESKPFKIPEESNEGGRISGFFGWADTCLNSIGAYVGHY